MSDTIINPLDYATQFTFPDVDNVDILVSVMVDPDKWMVTRKGQVLTVDNRRIPLTDLSPSNVVDVALVGFDRDRAVAIAHHYANRI